MLIVTRFVQWIGYITVISAAPVLIVRAPANRDRPVAFGFWSFHMAIGMATLVATTGNWQSGPWLTVASCGLGLIIAFLLGILDRRAGLV